jgi:nicotinamide mononucleotide (NMN) deamidase PncC
VYIHAATPEAAHGIEFTYGQDRESIRRRATVSSLHLLRRVLTQSRDEAA